MNTIPIGTKVTTIYEPDKVGMVKSVNTKGYFRPVYTVIYPDGNEYANYAEVLCMVEVTVDTVLRYGEVLTDDQINFSCNGIGTWVRIRTVKENGQLYYIRMVNGEVEEFKELI